MKGKLIGFESVNYTKSNGTPVEGCNIYFTVRSASSFGSVGRNEFISARSPVYARSILPVLDYLNDEASGIYGCNIDIDYDVNQRGNQKYTSVTDISFDFKSK